ncbi:MAG: alanine racemase [Lachnospiraceae bacterium]|nr:alanine racemase [Lachnospiraceae bacterium]
MRSEKDYQRIYAKINLDALVKNLEQIHKVIDKDTKVIAVIKADGYGHGAVPIAKTIAPLPYLWGFAVATAQEGIVLRRHGIKNPILILGHSFESEFEEIALWDLQPTVFSFSSAQALSEIGRKFGKEIKIHIKIDTGMSRIGYQVTEESADEIEKMEGLSNLVMEGIFTHFAKADELDKTHVKGQIALYQKMISMLKKRGLEIPLKHCSNSAGIIDLPQANMDAVRAGIILYGLLPSDEVKKERLPLKPILELKSKIICIKTLMPGRTIGYGGTYEVRSPQKIATIPVGYGDGYPRSLSNCGYVLIRGKKAPICGRVCMDQFMVDVTEISGVEEGDFATLLGWDGEEHLSMETLAELSGRFNYEFACDLGKRIPRVFCRNGEIVDTRDNFDE